VTAHEDSLREETPLNDHDDTGSAADAPPVGVAHNDADDGVAGPPQPPDGCEQSEPLHDSLARLTEAVSDLASQAGSHHARAEARERVIDNLHAEVERLRVGAEGLVLRPVVMDLQNLRADLLHQARVLPAEVSRKFVADLLDSFALSVELALERCGSVPIRPSVGDPFSAREHHAIKRVPALHPDQDQTIADVVADGYRSVSTERVTKQPRVHVYRWTAEEFAAPNDTENEQPDSGEQEEKSADG
jgi:molecular chaperone GrpE